MMKNRIVRVGAARNEEVAKGSYCSGSGDPSLYRPAQCDRRYAGEDEPSCDGNRSAHDRHVQAGNRQDVEDACVTVGFVGLLADASSLAGHERLRYCAHLPG
jgi:hypothetical protein